LDVSYLPGVKPLLHGFIHGGKDGVPAVEVFFDWLEGKKLDWSERVRLWPYVSAWAVVKKVLHIDPQKVEEIVLRKKELINAARNVIDSVLEFGVKNPIVLRAPLVVYYELAKGGDLHQDKEIIRDMWQSGVCMLEFVLPDAEIDDGYVTELVGYAREMGYGVAVWVRRQVEIDRLCLYVSAGVRSVELSVDDLEGSRGYLLLLHDGLKRPIHVRLSLNRGVLASLEESLLWLFSEVAAESVELVSAGQDWSKEEMEEIFAVYRRLVGEGYYLVADSLLPQEYIGSLNEINTRFVRLSGSVGKKVWEYLGHTGEGRVWGYIDGQRKLYASFDTNLPIGNLKGCSISELWYDHHAYSSETVEAETLLPSNPGSRFTCGGEESPSSVGQGAG